MQRELIPLAGGPPKGRLGLLTAWLACCLALPLPARPRIVFAFLLNFADNRLGASAALAGGWLRDRAARALTALVYFLVLGPTAVLARLMGRDYLGVGAGAESFFLPKDPPDPRERLLRQY